MPRIRQGQMAVSMGADHLPRLNVEQAFAQVRLPLHLNWSTPGRVFDLASRYDRARVYESRYRPLGCRPAPGWRAYCRRSTRCRC